MEYQCLIETKGSKRAFHARWVLNTLPPILSVYFAMRIITISMLFNYALVTVAIPPSPINF